MLTIKQIIVKNMRKITIIMMVIILFLSSIIQMVSMQQTGIQNAQQIFSQVEQILDENSSELEQVQEEYRTMCLNDARMVAYILEYNPKARDDIDELKKIAKYAEVDEIHIFNSDGVIVTGTHPEYYGFSVNSGEQIGFFKPLLADKSLELVQDMMPNTAENKMVQYSALWSEDGTFIVQIGMASSTVLRATQKNELSYIFSLLRTGVGYSLYAVDPTIEKVVGSTVVSDVDKQMTSVGFQKEMLESDHAFYARIGQTMSYCLAKKIGENYIIWTTPTSTLYNPLITNEILLLAGLIFISIILVSAVTHSMNRIVIDQIQRINEKLRDIQNGNLKTKVDVNDSKEFLELSAHINSMVDSLLHISEKLEMGEQIKRQKEALEKQREQLEVAVERAEAANKAKSEFLFNMSHDIRTPMNAILGFTNFALETGDPELQKTYLKNIDVSSKQLLDLINNILELSRIENQKIIIEEDLVKITETYKELCTIFDSDLKKKHLTYNVDFDIKHPDMYMDTTHFSQIFLNVVSNAIKYTPERGSISVSFKEYPGDSPETCYVETRIKDNGIGMSKEFLSHAYESFSRERTSTVSGIQGTGLGLAIVKNLVELMRGTIHIESQQGNGTEVIIRLPHRLGQTSVEKHREEMAAFDSTLFKGIRILLAEDIDINAMIATKLLTDKGCIVERAKDGVECVNMLLKSKDGYYDLILMDIQMPNMDGYQAAKSIRAFEEVKKSSIPIIAMTANAFKEDRDKAAEAGMNGHISKPLDTIKMFKTMADVLMETRGKH